MKTSTDSLLSCLNGLGNEFVIGAMPGARPMKRGQVHRGVAEVAA